MADPMLLAASFVEEQMLAEGEAGVDPEQNPPASPPILVGKTRLDRLLDLSVALFWVLAAAANLQAVLDGGSVLSVGRLVFYSLLAFLFLRRRPVSRKGSWWQSILAWVGTILPMISLSDAPAGWSLLGLVLQALGLLAMILALTSLGRSFGVAPGDRGLVRGGLYRWVRHPLYAAELWFLVGYLIAHPSWRNTALLVVIAAIQVIRALCEEKVISGYKDYAGEVRWRLLPLVW